MKAPRTKEEKDELEFGFYLAKWANEPEFEDIIMDLDTSTKELEASLYGEAV